MLYIPHPYKYCHRCGEYKPPSEFHRNRSKKDGLGTECKECSCQRVRCWCERHPEQTASNKTLWAQHNYLKRRDSVSRYFSQNRDQINAAKRSRYAQNPFRRKQQGHRYRATQRELPSDFEQSDWERALDFWHGVCAYCGNPPQLWDKPRALQQDHFVPVARGGAYTKDNMLPACKTCNSGKKNSDPVEWIRKRFGKKRAKIILKRIEDYFERVHRLEG